MRIVRMALWIVMTLLPGCGTLPRATIVRPAGASSMGAFAAREIQRYGYLRCDARLPILETMPDRGDVVRLAVDPSLADQQYTLRTRVENGRKVLTITGGSDVAMLYGAYQFAEKLGVRFNLYGDVIPDQQRRFVVPDLNETHKPLFALRGILPFHDFPEGPDWWTADDYKAYLSQLAKLRMNWFGLHCYPEGGVGPEPSVWIGVPEDVNRDGTVKFSSASRWTSTARTGSWGYAATPTGAFAAGAWRLFETDVWGHPIQRGNLPEPTTPAGCNEVFNRAGVLFNKVFSYGHEIGIRFCIGTETPLHIPKAVQARLQEKGLDPKDPAVIRKVYEGMFTRITRTHPLDDYWLWTNEGWTWRDPKPEYIESVKQDITLALEALAKIGKPFDFATCGWVLGPPSDRAMFDKILPKSVSISCINRQVGFSPVEPAFQQVSGRGKWAIPWLEDDPALTVAQLWAGRMRRDAADALAYGCNGLMGIHWRTKVLAPNIAALAKAAWDQSGWNATPGQPPANEKRDLPIDDFYRDWCRANFGRPVDKKLAALFVRLDGGGLVKVHRRADRATHLPRPVTWMGGPGGIRPNGTAWEQEKKRYAFVDEMAAWRPSVKGAGNRARFDYWLNTFRCLRAVGRIGCMRGRLDQLVKQIDAEPNPASKKQLIEQQALPLRLAMARQWERIITLQLAATDTPGAMGTIANLEQHAYRSRHLVDAYDEKLTTLLGWPLPRTARPTGQYLGRPRLIVPTVRSVRQAGEPLTIKVIVLDNQRPRQAALHWRPMGRGRYRSIPLKHVARGVHTVMLPPAANQTIEYYLTATTAAGRKLTWPATAPRINQTVVVMGD